MRVFGGLAVLFALATIGWGCFSLRRCAGTAHVPLDDDLARSSTASIWTAGDADVTIVPDATDQIVVDTTVQRGLQHADTEAFERDGALVVRSVCHGPFGWTCSVSMTIHVPTEVDVVGHLGDGYLTDRGTHGVVQVSTGDGDIDLDGIEGAVKLQTGDGDVQIYGLVAPDVQVSTGDGDMDVELASSPNSITLHSGDGDVDVCLPRTTPPYAVTSHLGNGSLDNQLATDPGADRTLHVTTGDGDALLHLC